MASGTIQNVCWNMGGKVGWLFSCSLVKRMTRFQVPPGSDTKAAKIKTPPHPTLIFDRLQHAL